ncbi:hypothetical protein LTR36_007545 [Oleoguttula mirabilis]|uniref:Uncharacterized protein n=1 Tax=Oleoguttula mirabilis TaxID=1507867 RepID=A0AAV9JWU8_9PEZI|nr:hypothetical protein LTR36_007545 [Oleoguttula mirabilis]
MFALKTDQELATLRATPNITIANAATIHWANAAYWVHENNIHTMSPTDLDVYNPLMTHYEQSYKEYEAHMLPAHYKVLNDLWLYMKPAAERRFRRLPVAKSNQVKQALLEHEGADNLPDDCLPTPVLEQRRMFADVLPTSVFRAAKERRDSDGSSETEWCNKVFPEIQPASSESVSHHHGSDRADDRSAVPHIWCEVVAEELAPSTQASKQLRTEKSSVGDHPASTISTQQQATANPSSQPPYAAATSARTSQPDSAMARSVRAPSASAVETAAETVAARNPEERQVAPPLLAEVGERVVLLTAGEADAAERAWIEWGEEWYERSGLF